MEIVTKPTIINHKMHLFGYTGANESYAEADTILRGMDV
ncbi:hypothetical protein SASC598J21_001620, partial [Snodgrassella alvi SCGC AB-598-J21]